MSHMMQPRVIILKEEADTSQGRGQLISNINACEAVVSILKTTLGPRGMDKLIHDGKRVTISNDGATIIRLLDIVHPAAKMLVDIARSQDAEVGDGTTSVCLLAAEFLSSVKQFIEDGVYPQTIIRGLRLANQLAQAKIKEVRVSVDKDDHKETRSMLLRCAATALNSKLVSGHRDFFAKMAVDAVLSLDESRDLDLIGVHKVAGGSLNDSFLVQGVAFRRTFSYAGFEQQPKKLKNPKILALNVELELKAEEANAEMRLKSAEEYQKVVDTEWKLMYRRLDKIVDSGANIILSKLPIGDLATQYFADRKIFCAGRVPDGDLLRVCKATGAIMQTSLSDLNETVLGGCEDFEERQVGGMRYNIITGCPGAKTCSVVLRGGAEQLIAEAQRSLHDAIMIVKRVITYAHVVGGGGALEMTLSRHLKLAARKIEDKTQMIVQAVGQALEVVPRQLSINAGLDATDIINQLRIAHSKSDTWEGVEIEDGGICNTFDKFIWEPSLVKQNAIAAAVEAACVILSVDETVKNPKSEGLNDNRPAPVPRGR